MALLVAGEGARALTDRLAALTGGTLVATEFKTFPDGEEYARILAPVKGEDVVVVQTTWPPPRLWKLLLLLNAARENGARRVRCVAPYLAYARQDRVFLQGEALSARVALESIRLYADACVTVDLHRADVARFFGEALHNLSAVEPFARDFQKRGIDLVLAPDAGARERARAVADRIRAEHDHLEKKRISGEIVEVRPKSLPVQGKHVAILDDIISTGGTMAKATEQLVAQGARSVVCAGVHGLFIAGALEKLKRAGAAEVVSTDTIESPYSLVSVAELVADALELGARPRLHKP